MDKFFYNVFKKIIDRKESTFQIKSIEFSKY